jgi:hypothetical protein
MCKVKVPLKDLMGALASYKRSSSTAYPTITLVPVSLKNPAIGVEVSLYNFPSLDHLVSSPLGYANHAYLA